MNQDIQIYNFKNDIRKLINNSNLPITVLSMIMKETTNDVMIEEQRYLVSILNQQTNDNTPKEETC